jgi:class 3 adenylate cyclase/tetratricopeptide (TPR) repeat protein
VTVTFTDLVGFTPFAEERDAEEVRDTLGRYFDLARLIVERYGGAIEKFIGDAVMAVWGAPVAHEDDAERAVRAGLELVDAVPALGPGVQARCGILTGEAAVTLGAVNQGMVAGDLVNTAARLQGVAEPGTVLVGEATQRAAARAIAFVPAGEQALKGKTAPVAAWRALRVVSEVGGRNREEGLEAPFVGRADELRLLKDLFHATSREKRLRLVSVMGPAGIGKSRLAWEFLKYIDGLVETVWWHDGRSPAYGDGISLWALGEMVRARCGLRETDDEATTRERVRATVARHVPDADEARWVEGALLALLGLEAEIAADQLFAAWRTFFERLSASGTVVLVFEDFHFADSGLLDLVDHLLEWSRGAPIYVLTLARPELLERRPSWGAGTRSFVSLPLDPLPEAAMRELLLGLIPGLPEDALRAIIGRADGMPMYAVETVRMLVADGRLQASDGTYVATGDLTSLAVPDSLTALIAARLDGLDPADRSLVQDAAVLGQSFTLAGLAAVSGTGEAELELRLRGLVRRELLRVEANHRSPELGSYVFVQALIREVAYNTLARRDRKVRHLAAARFFESLLSDELAGALAAQYLAAHANATDAAEAAALATQARLALSAAATRAVALGAHEQAVTFLVQAAEISPDPHDQAALLVRAARSAGAAARYARAEELAREAIARFDDLHDLDSWADATAALASTLVFARRIDEAAAVLDAALGREDALGEVPRAWLLATLSRVRMRSDRNREAVEAADRALAIAEPLRIDAITGEALENKASALANLGRIRESVGLHRAAIELAREVGLTELELRAGNNLSAAVSDDDPAFGHENVVAVLALAEKVGNRGMADFLAWTRSQYAFTLGLDWAGELARLEQHYAELAEPNDRPALLGMILAFKTARGEASDEELLELDRATAGTEDPGIRGIALLARVFHGAATNDLEMLGRAVMAGLAVDEAMSGAYAAWGARRALWVGDAAGARGMADRLDALPTAESLSGKAQRLSTRAGIAALEGRQQEAVGLYRDALRLWSLTRQDTLGALIALDMAILLDPRLPEVRSAAARAREVFERNGMRPFLERLDAALAPTAAGDRGDAARSAGTAAPTAEAGVG